MYIVIVWYSNTCASGYTHKCYHYSLVVTICTARFNIHKFYVHTHGVFMCFVWV